MSILLGLNERQIKSIAHILKYDLPYDNTIVDAVSDIRKNIIIRPEDGDDKITKAFKGMILYGSIVEATNKTRLYEKFTDIIIYTRPDDIDLTLLGKCLYSISGKIEADFVRHQINVILTTGDLDPEKEFIKYETKRYQDKGYSQNAIDRFIRKDLERIEWYETPPQEPGIIPPEVLETLLRPNQ